MVLGGAILSSGVTSKPKGLSAKLQSLWDRVCAGATDPCQALIAEIEATILKMRNLRSAMLTDPRRLFTNAFNVPNPAVTGTSTTWTNHQTNYENERAKLLNLIALARQIPCVIPPDAEIEANIAVPSSPRLTQ